MKLLQERTTSGSIMDDYFVYCKIFLSILGQWPYQSWILAKFLQYIWTIQHISILVPEVVKMCECRKDIDLIIESLPNILYNTVMAAKFINGVVKQHQIKTVLTKIKQDWNELVVDKQTAILRSFYDSGRLLIIIYICLVYSVLLSFMFIPLTPTILDIINPLNESRPKAPLYIVEFFVDQDKYYYTILTHAYVTSLFGILPLFASDILLCNCVHHASGMLTILGHRVQNVLNKGSTKDNIDEKRIYEQAVDCVRQHQRIIEFCDDVNEIYSTAFFYILTLCIITMSVTGMATVIKLEESFDDCFRFAMFAVAQTFHMFCYNYMGQKLIDQGDQLLGYICKSDWHLASAKTKYIVKFMIFRNSKPKKLQAKIFSLTLENFTSVMKSSMSYFTVLKSTR